MNKKFKSIEEAAEYMVAVSEYLREHKETARELLKNRMLMVPRGKRGRFLELIGKRQHIFSGQVNTGKIYVSLETLAKMIVDSTDFEKL